MDVTNKRSAIIIGNEEVSADWLAVSYYKLTRSAAPFLLMVSDKNENSIRLLLLKRNAAGAEVVDEAVVPLKLSNYISTGLTGYFFKQLKAGGGQNIQNAFSEFQNLFESGISRGQYMNDLSKIVSSYGLSFSRVNQVVAKLLNDCRIDYSTYITMKKRANAVSPVWDIYAYAMLEVISFAKAISKFLEQYKEQNIDISMTQICMCGRIRDLILLVEPEMYNSANISYPSVPISDTRSMVYRILASILAQKGAKGPAVNIINQDFEVMILRNVRQNNQQNDSFSLRPDMVQVYNEKLLWIPKDAGITAANVNGPRYKFNGSLVKEAEGEDMVCVLPYSDEFSTLIALGEVQIEKAELTKTAEGWQFETVFGYRGRKFCPKPRVFSSDNTVRLTELPVVVMFKSQQDGNMYIMSNNVNDMRIEVYNGQKVNGAVKLPQSKVMYLKIYGENNCYLGQTDYSFVKRRS